MSHNPLSCHSSDHLIASAGATQGLNLVAQLLFDRNDLVFIENPTYFIATKVLKDDAGLKLISGMGLFV